MKDQEGIQLTVKANAGLHRFAIILACLTVVLLAAGALVTSNEAGDSVPDWPLSFGRWLVSGDHFVANVRYEYSHRFIAGIVGAATFLLAVSVWLADRRRWMRRLVLVVFAGVVAQAVIGGVRVYFPEYKALIAVPHALVAQSFFGAVVALAVFTSRSWLAAREVRLDQGKPPLRTLTAVTVAAVLIQLVLGAGFRHQAFGIVPHVIGAVAVAGLIVWTSIVVLRRHKNDDYLTRPAWFAAVLLVAQLSLGIGAYFARVASAGDPQPLEPMISLTVAHLVVGALTLATMIVLTLRCHRALAEPAAEALLQADVVQAASLRPVA
ncbi:MAG: COX15/CtaA family protein [Acidobacteriota bacterium]